MIAEFSKTDFHYFTLAFLAELGRYIINNSDYYDSNKKFCQALQHVVTNLSKQPELHEMGIRRLSVKKAYKTNGGLQTLYDSFLKDVENPLFHKIQLTIPNLFAQYKDVCKHILNSKNYKNSKAYVLLDTSFNLLNHNKHEFQNLYPLDTMYDSLHDCHINLDLLKANIYTADFMAKQVD